MVFQEKRAWSSVSCCEIGFKALQIELDIHSESEKLDSKL